MTDIDSAKGNVSFAEAFRFWLKLGFISFGGPAGQIATMHRELVEKRRWLSEKRFLHALSYCTLLPGPEAQQLATYIGWLMHRTWGGIVAGSLFVIPSFFVLLGLSYVYVAYGHLPAIGGIIDGFKPVVAAIVVEALFKIGGRALSGPLIYGIAIVAFVSIYFFSVPFPVIVLAAAAVGVAGTRFLPKTNSPEAEGTVEAKAGTDRGLAISDDASPLAHTVPSRIRIVKTVLVGLLLWLIPYLFLIVFRGNSGIHMQEYQFFTVAAFVTFGGAYAVLAYVTQALTTAPYNWITPVQAVDGLALAETTPGPLIMVLQFVGFIAGWNYPPDGMHPLASGILGAVVTTYATFLPSFFFIFVGAPYIEKLRENKILRGMLTSVTGAVVGVILNLAIVFGAAVFLSPGDANLLNWFAVVLSSAAFVVLYFFKIDVLWVILAGGVIGFIKGMVGPLI